MTQASPHARIRAAAALVAALALPVVTGVAAQTPRTPSASTTQSTSEAAAARDAALRALAARLRLPLLDEAVSIFSRQLRRTLPAYFVASVGDQANLGSAWRPGDPLFDESLRRVDAALGVEEARNGPLVKLEPGDLLLAVRVPWTRDDIAFVEATLPTDLGHEAERAIDAKAAQQTIATLRRRVAPGLAGDGIARAFADLDARAQSQFGDALLMLLAQKSADPVRAQRLQRLIETVSVEPSDAVGQRIADRLSARLLDAAAAQLPEIIAAILTGRGR
jgi:uncharacterized protein (DUF2267 family)